MSDLINRLGLTVLQIMVTGAVIIYLIENFNEILEIFNQLVISRIVLY